MSRHGGNTIPLYCETCGWNTYRNYDDDRGFGVCIKCAGVMRRTPQLANAKRTAKAKRELEGGPSR